MAAFDVAYNWMMDSEDPERACKIVPDDPPGAHSISGINSAAFPTDYAAIAAISQESRAASVLRFYQVHFWNVWYEQLASDEVAKRVFDAAVNMGAGTAVKLLQRALQDALGAFVAVDGQWGPQTLQHANACNPDMVCAGFRRVRTEHYQDIAKANPSEAQYLRGWLTRAER